jgi:hypothetical protein
VQKITTSGQIGIEIVDGLWEKMGTGMNANVNVSMNWGGNGKWEWGSKQNGKMENPSQPPLEANSALRKEGRTGRMEGRDRGNDCKNTTNQPTKSKSQI